MFGWFILVLRFRLEVLSLCFVVWFSFESMKMYEGALLFVGYRILFSN